MSSISRLFALMVLLALALPFARAQDAASAPFHEPTAPPEPKPSATVRPKPTPTPPEQDEMENDDAEEAAPSPTTTPAPRSSPAGKAAPAAAKTVAPPMATPTATAVPAREQRRTEDESRPPSKPKATPTPPAKRSAAEESENNNEPIAYFAVRSKLRELETKWQKSVAAKDVSVIEEIVADDFIGTGSGGRVGGKSTLKREAKDDKNTYDSAVARHLSVRSFGAHVAIVTGTTKERGKTTAGKAFEHEYRFTDTWMERRGKWQCIASHATLLPKK